MMFAIEVSVLVGDLERRPRRIYRSDLIANARQVQRESALVGEAVECFSMCISSSRRIVLALIEKCPGLLSAEGVEVEADSVERKIVDRLFSAQDLRLLRRQLFQLANVRIDTFDESGFGKMFGERIHHDLSQSSRSKAWVRVCMVRMSW